MNTPDGAEPRGGDEGGAQRPACLFCRTPLTSDAVCPACMWLAWMRPEGEA
jgi:hypothetical protein